MDDAFEPDLGLFRLPLPDLDPDPADSPEQACLTSGAGSATRAGKQAFWERITVSDLVPECPDLSVVRDLVSPERLADMARGPGVLQEPTSIEPPPEVRSDLGNCSPQFCLRNLWRYEKTAWVDLLWWNWSKVRDTPSDAASDLALVRKLDRVVPGPLLAELSMARLASLQQERHEVLDELDWRAFTWRRGPRGQLDDYMPDTAE